MLIWKLWIRRWKEFLTFQFHHILSWWGKKEKVLFSSEDCCVFRESFPVVQDCHLPCVVSVSPALWLCTTLHTACTAAKNHYNITLSLKGKQHHCKFHLKLKVKFFLPSGSCIISNNSNPFRFSVVQIHYSLIISPVSSGQHYFLSGVVHVSLGA